MVSIEDIIRLMKAAGIARGKAETLSHDAPLDEQGIDSYDRMSLLTELEEQYAVEIPNEVARSLKSLVDVVQFLNQRPQE